MTGQVSLSSFCDQSCKCCLNILFIFQKKKKERKKERKERKKKKKRKKRKKEKKERKKKERKREKKEKKKVKCYNVTTLTRHAHSNEYLASFNFKFALDIEFSHNIDYPF